MLWHEVQKTSMAGCSDIYTRVPRGRGKVRPWTHTPNLPCIRPGFHALLHPSYTFLQVKIQNRVLMNNNAHPRSCSSVTASLSSRSSAVLHRTCAISSVSTGWVVAARRSRFWLAWYCARGEASTDKPCGSLCRQKRREGEWATREKREDAPVISGYRATLTYKLDFDNGGRVIPRRCWKETARCDPRVVFEKKDHVGQNYALVQSLNKKDGSVWREERQRSERARYSVGKHSESENRGRANENRGQRQGPANGTSLVTGPLKLGQNRV